jgi:hypothetical protein
MMAGYGPLSGRVQMSEARSRNDLGIALGFAESPREGAAFDTGSSRTAQVCGGGGSVVPSSAAGLIGLSNTVNTYGKTRAFHKQTIDEALRFFDR